MKKERSDLDFSNTSRIYNLPDPASAQEPATKTYVDSLSTAFAGGVLSGAYPNPGFAVDMATQGELDVVYSNLDGRITANVTAIAGKQAIIPVAAAGKILRSTGVVADWSTAIFPDTVVAGDLLIGTGVNAWGRLGAGVAGQVLTAQGAGAAPAWVSAGVTTIANGGTNASSQILNAVMRFDGTGITGSSALSFNGTHLTAVGSINAFATATDPLAGFNINRDVSGNSGYSNYLSKVYQRTNGNCYGIATESYVNTSSGTTTSAFAGVFTAGTSTRNGVTNPVGQQVVGIFGQVSCGSTATVSSLVAGMEFSVGCGGSTPQLIGAQIYAYTYGAGTVSNSLIGLDVVTTCVSSVPVPLMKGLAITSGGLTGGAGATTFYGIYIDNTIVAANKWAIYSLYNAPSYIVGKVGIGSGLTAPSARLTVRDTVTQFQVEYDVANYYNATVSSTGQVVLNATGINKSFQFATGNALGFFGAVPAPQPTTAFASSVFTANAGVSINDLSTFDGYTIPQIAKALRTLGILA